MTVKTALLRTASIAAVALFSAVPALAQDADSGSVVADEDSEIQTSQDIVVQGQIGYRNRVETTEPVLVYDTDYFQRFEPLSAGDALKRVPSVTFLSDVLESDGVRLRGLDPAYTQILINGEQVPGAGSSSGAIGNGAETAFFVDRIPAELIERVEIVRSASANRSGDAMAGALSGGPFADLAKRNMELFKTAAGVAKPAEPAPAGGKDEELAELKRQLAELQSKVDKLAG